MVKSMRGGFIPKKTMGRVKSVGRATKKSYTVLKKVVPVVKEATQELNMPGAIKVLGKLEESMKQPKGSNGLALGPTKLLKFSDQSINSPAVGSSTYSNTFYAYRPKVDLKSPRQRYRQKTAILTNKTIGDNQQQILDISLLDAVPVLNNPDSDSKYTNLSIKAAFDNVLRAVMTTGGSSITQRESNTTIHLDLVAGEFLITNGSTASEVTIYDCIPQYDLGPTTYSSEAYSVGYMSPSWCWYQGLDAADTLYLNDQMTPYKIGAKPTDSVTFSRAWKIIKRTTIRMTSNAVHKHNFVCGINKSIPYQRYAQASSGGGKFGGYCPTSMLMFRGLPTSTQQATSAEVNVSCNLEFRYSSNLNQSTQAIVYDSTT
jgi:hypothetical protein